MQVSNQHLCAPSCRNYPFSEQRIYSSYRFSYPNDLSTVCKRLTIFWRTNTYRSSDFFYDLAFVTTQKSVYKPFILPSFKVPCAYMGIPIAEREVPKIA